MEKKKKNLGEFIKSYKKDYRVRLKVKLILFILFMGPLMIFLLYANSKTENGLMGSIEKETITTTTEKIKKTYKQVLDTYKETYNKNFRFTITTNGLLLTDDKIEYINKEMSNVVLSIDGRKEVNDKMRVRVDGSGCYDKIVENYKKLVAGRGDKEYYVRGTYTKYNLDFAEDVIHLYNAGFDQISVEPVMEDDSIEYAITEADLDKIYAEYDKLVDKVAELKKEDEKFNFFHFMIDLDQGPCVIKRLRGCGSGNEYVAITPDGDIYPCHQFVGHEEYKMGNLEEHTFNENIKKVNNLLLLCDP